MRPFFLPLVILLGFHCNAVATWSVIAVDQKTGRVAIASATCVSQERFHGFPAKGLMDIQAIVVPGKGVAAAQAAVDRTRKNQQLIFREMQKGTPPAEILELLKPDPEIERRQFAIVDLEGRRAGFSGSGNGKVSLDVQGEVAAERILFSVQGNILASEEVVHAAVRAFRETSGELADRVIAAMEAADAEGGDRRCTCESLPATAAPCDRKTSHVAYLLVAKPEDPSGSSYNDGRYDLYLDVNDQNIQPQESANPVKTLRRRYDAWKKGAATPAGALSVSSLLEIRFPSRAVWSPAGERIAWVWDRGGVQNLFVVGAGGGTPRALTDYAEGMVDAIFWSGDGRLLFFSRQGDLWQVAPEGGEPRAVWTTPEGEGDFSLSPEGGRVAFARAGDLWVRSLADGREIRLTTTEAGESGPVWSPDGKRIAFTFSSATARQDVFDYVGAKLAFRRFERTLPDVGVVSASGGPVVVVAASAAAESTPRWVDPNQLSLQRVSTDYRTREVLLADATRGETRVLHRDFDEKWWSIDYLGPEPTPSPDGRFVAFLSDRDGWDHLYVVPAAGGALHQITRGEFEVGRPAWSPDGSRIAFDTNEGHPGQRHLAVAEIGANPSRAKIVRLSSGRGTHTQPTDRYGFILERPFGGWSPDGRRLLYHHTDPREPGDLLVVEATGAGTAPPYRLTDSVPTSFDRSGLVEPELVRYRASDGAEVPAYLFLPRGLDRSRRHPAIVWIHGDGIAQNYDGWHIRRDYAVYYSFHQYLVQKGYVVLAPDYRGSVGYGREWRRAPYRDVGGRDFQDVADSIPYLSSLGFVDLERVGVWGLSYGGFFTLQALTLTPDLFRCGVNVAGVQDYRYWYRDPGGRWIVSRMGSPEENPDAYLRAAPIERVDRIRRPLLVLHGTADVNVPFLESVRLVDALTRADKEVDFMMYPGEFHYFHRQHVLRDAWQRVERFFDRHLRKTSGGAGTP
jgi:dipeptidyl aminopeptidase/acylaminoacyl peptidase